ncbi:MAG TPA: S8 family serine peptidase [Pyrinomonadaceae bacterium]|nr:S8 family serine peptidase [Pyrinomonadaceae bacterium]
MSNGASKTTDAGHEHSHAQNRFAVIPTPVRLDADAGYAGRGVTIAFLDSGFYPHPDLTEPHNRIKAFFDIMGEEPTLGATPQPWHWHGTQTTVAAAGCGLLSDGVYRGVAHEASLVLVKVSERGHITEDAIVRGIEWVVENRERLRIRVLNISLGGDEDVPCSRSVIDQAAERAVAAGIVVVVAAGNSGYGERPHSIPPANSPSVITVGGYDDNNSLESGSLGLYHSNYGPTADGTLKPEIVGPAMWVAAPILPETELYRTAEALSQLASAPDYSLRELLRQLWREADLPESILDEDVAAAREIIESRLRRDKIVAAHYQHVDGTSFAAPIVSSVVAQMLEANTSLTPAAVKHVLISTADRIAGAPLARQGYGVLNARRAVAESLCEQHTLDGAAYGPPRVCREGVLFSFHDDSAREVALAGDFNGWKPSRTRLVKGSDGVWLASVEGLLPGRYRYKLVVDGARWTDDPANGLKEPDEFGGFNSVLNVV